MSEFGPSGLLAVLLLFTALTLRDVYVGRSKQQPADGPSPLPDTGPGEHARASAYTGPVLRFRYW